MAFGRRGIFQRASNPRGGEGRVVTTSAVTFPQITDFTLDALYSWGDSAAISSFYGAFVSVKYNNDGSRIYVCWDIGNNSSYIKYTSPDLSPVWVPVAETLPATGYTEAGNTRMRCMGWSSDGTKVYIGKLNSDVITEYDNTGTAYNFTSGDLTSPSTFAATDPIDLHVTDDGSQIFWLQNGSLLRSLTMSTPDDITTASAGNTFDHSSQGTANKTGVVGNSDFSVFYLLDLNGTIYEYECSTPGDLSTTSYTGRSKNIVGDLGSGDDAFWGLDISSDYKHLITYSRDSTVVEYGAIAHYTSS